jgi:predicted amidophosphoribosyltransferase
MEESDEEQIDSLEVDTTKIKLVRRSVKGRVKLCPRCLSKLEKIGELSGWLVPDDYLCEKCGYHGHVALEATSQEQVPPES